MLNICSWEFVPQPLIELFFFPSSASFPSKSYRIPQWDMNHCIMSCFTSKVFLLLFKWPPSVEMTTSIFVLSFIWGNKLLRIKNTSCFVILCEALMMTYQRIDLVKSVMVDNTTSSVPVLFAKYFTNSEQEPSPLPVLKCVSFFENEYSSYKHV